MAIQVQFGDLHCNSTDDSSTDEIFVKWAGQRIWGPVDMEEGKTINVDKFVLLQGDSSLVELFDEDWPSDDHLGGYVIRREEVGGPWRAAKFKNEDADYDLWYHVFEG